MVTARIALLTAICIAGSSRPAVTQTPEGRTAGLGAAAAAQLRELRAYPHLDRAYRLIGSNRLQEARTEFERHLAIDPQSVKARTAYAMLLFRLKAYPDVIRQADAIVQAQPTTAEAWLYRGMARQALGDDDAAFSDLQTAARLDSIGRTDRQYALSAAADAALGRRRYEAALSALEPLGTLQKDYRLEFRQGLALEGLGRFEAAAEAYRRALGQSKSAEDRLAVHRALAAIAKRTGNWTAERTALTLALQLAPHDFSIVQGLIDGATVAEDHRDAARWLRLAVAQRPSPERRFALATALALARNYAEAAGEFAAAAREATSRDDQHRAWMGAAEAYTSITRHAVAATMYRRAAMVKRNAPTLAALALSYERSGQLEDASRVWREARQMHESPEYAAHAGMLEAKMGDTESAVRHLTAALSGSLPRDARARVLRQLGYLHRAAGRLSDAAQAFKQALALGRSDPQIHLALGEIHRALDNPRAAIEHLTIAAPIVDTPEAWHLLAASYAAAAQPKQALELYRSAYDRSGRREWSLLMHAAEVSAAAGRWSDAEADLARTLAHKDLPGAARADALERLGIAYSAQNKTAQAIEVLQLVTSLDSRRLMAWQHLGYALFKAERWQDALDAFRTGHGQNESPRALVSMARCYERLGKPGLALHMVRRAAPQRTRLPVTEQRELLAALGYLLADAGDVQAAADAWREALAIEFEVDTALSLSAAYRKLGRVESAARLLDDVQARTRSATQPALYAGERAAVLAAGGNCRAAADALALTDSPEPRADRFHELGVCATARKDSDDAIAYFESAVALEPRNSEYLVALGFAYKAAQRYLDAARTFEVVLDLEPDYLSLYEELGYVYSQQGRAGDAKQWFTRAIDNAALYPADSSEERAQLARRLYSLRQANLWLSNRIDVSAYSFLRGESGRFGATATRGRRPAFGGVELSFRPAWPWATPVSLQLFGRATTAASSEPSGAGTHRVMSAGVRVLPFRAADFALSVERAVAGDADHRWLVRTAYAHDRSRILKPGRTRWPYALFYSDAAAALDGERITTVYAEARRGTTLNVGDAWLFSPHLIANSRLENSRPFGLHRLFEGGAGVSLKYLFNETAHTAHRSALEVALHYRGRVEHPRPAGVRNAGWSLTSVVSF